MSKSIKFKNDTYLDSSSIIHKKEKLSDLLEPRTIIVEDVICKNIFNKNDVIKDYRLGGDGTLYAQNGYNASDFIKVEPNTTYYRNIVVTVMETVCQYDKNKNFISRQTNSLNIIITDSNCYYIRTSISTTNLDICQLEKGRYGTKYVEHKNFTNEEIYSTNERKIGIFLDKPLYKKTIYISSLPNATSVNYAHNISNISTIVKAEAMAIRDNQFFPLPFTNNAISSSIVISYSTTNISINTNSFDRSNCSAYVTLYYTKTTD